MSREQRKLDHIKYALKLGDGPQTSGLEHVHFVHNCLPELNPQDISLSSRFGGILLLSPFLINAVTGGAEAVTEINRRLAQAAKKAGAALAVGSQYGAVKRKTNYYSYEVVREEYPDGVIFANTSALATPEEALETVKMIDADALQIHLNPAQELIMPEGDREFKGLFANMQRILEKCCVPVIVKETGCGMAARQVKQLLKAGFTCFDVGGAGGTNFPAIEAARYGGTALLNGWGLNTAQTLLETGSVCGSEGFIAATGGVRTGLDAAKCLALGADVIGMAGNVLAAAVNDGADAAAELITQAEDELRLLMLLTGAPDIRSMRTKPLYFTGPLLDFMQCRGWDCVELARSRR